MSDFNDRLTEAFALHDVIPDPLAARFYKTIMEANDPTRPLIQAKGGDAIKNYLLKLINSDAMEELETKLSKEYTDKNDLLKRVWIAMYQILTSDDPELQKRIVSQSDPIQDSMLVLTKRLNNANVTTKVARDQIDQGMLWLNKKYDWDLPTFIEMAAESQEEPEQEEPEEEPEPQPASAAAQPQQPTSAAQEASQPEPAQSTAGQPPKPEAAPSGDPEAAEPNDVEVVHTAGEKVMARIMGARKINGKTYKTIKYATFDGPTMARITDSSELTAQNIHKYIHILNDNYKKKKADITDPKVLKKLSKQYTSMYTDDNVSAYSKLAPAQPQTDNFEEYLAQMTGTSLKDGVIKALSRIMKGQSLLKAKSDPIFVAKNAQHAMSYLLSANDEIIGKMLNQYRPKLESVPIDDVIDRLSQTFNNQQKNNTNMESKLVDLSVISEVDWGKPLRNAKSALGKVSRWYNHSGRDLNAKDVRIAKRLCLYDMAATQIMLNPNQFYNNYLKPAGLGPKLKLPPAKKKMQQPVTPDQARDMDKDLANDYTNRMGDQSEPKPETAGMDKDLANDYSDRMGDQPEEAETPAQPQHPAQEPSRVAKNLVGKITGLRKQFNLNPKLETMITKEYPDIGPQLRLLIKLPVDKLIKRIQSNSEAWMTTLNDIEQLMRKMALEGIT